MNLVYAGLLSLHGIAHLVGFMAAWQLSDGAPHTTRVLAGRVDVGEVGIRVFGVLWALLALSFIVGAGALLVHAVWWRPLTLGAAIVSLLLCVTALPDAKLGIPANLAVILGATAMFWIRL